MSYGIRIECWGDYACFTRPEMKAERVSYDVMTPSAARGLVEAIFWHPGLRYIIDEIDVLSPIQFTNIRRNELREKISGHTVATAMKNPKKIANLYSQDVRDQRLSMILKDVHYCISVHFEMTKKANPSDNPGKFHEMLSRRAKKGQCYYQPYFGCREFPAAFRLVGENEIIQPYPETRDLGFMLYDMDFSNPKGIVPQFFRAKLVKGVLDLRNCEVHR